MRQQFFENNMFLGKHPCTELRAEHDSVDAKLDDGHLLLNKHLDGTYVVCYKTDKFSAQVIDLLNETTSHVQSRNLEVLNDSAQVIFEFMLNFNHFDRIEKESPQIFDEIISELEKKIGIEERVPKPPKEYHAAFEINKNIGVNMFKPVCANYPYIDITAFSGCRKEDFEKAAGIVNSYLSGREKEIEVMPLSTFTIYFSPYSTFESVLSGTRAITYKRLLDNMNHLEIKNQEELNKIIVKEGIAQLRASAIRPEYRSSFIKGLRGRPIDMICSENIKKFKEMFSMAMDDENLIIKSKNTPEQEDDIPEITEADLKEMFPILPPQKFSAKLNYSQRDDYKRTKDLFESLKQRGLQPEFDFNFVVASYGILGLVDELEQKTEFAEKKEDAVIN